jgi:Asp-tRNA(Asn)/Glu-tRNA(Gln) amidotransferase A subunit family amidase
MSKRLTAWLLGASLAATPAAAQRFDVMETTIAETHAALRAGRTTCRAIVEQYLARIAAYDKIGPVLNAIQHVNARALAEADSLDAVQRGRQTLGPLHCVPVLLKDQVETRDMPTTYGSALFRDFVPRRDATIVLRLEAAGAIILAKTTMGEFAARYVGSAFGIIRNAYDPTRNPSGSSGGSASGVAANFGLVGIGEDTGGSIRGPAAVSSLVGLRPTLQLVSRHGMMPANPTQDTMGPMTRCVADAARVLEVIAGYDPSDPITAESVGRMPASYATGLRADALRGVRIGVLRVRRDSAAGPDSTVAGLTDEYAKVRAVFDQAIRDLQAQGAEVVDSFVVPTLADRRMANDFETEQATDAYLAEHPNAPVKTLKEILLAGTVNPWRARGLIDLVGRRTSDPGYLTVMLQRAALRTAVLKAMADARLDVIVYATYDAPPTPIAADVLTNPRPADAYGRGDNRGLSPTIGFPALTVPAGFTSDALPVGLEFLGRPFTEAAMLGYGFAYEQATRHRRPPASTPALAR